MEKIAKILIFLILLSISLTGLADTLTTNFIGINGKILDNIKARFNIKQQLTQKTLTPDAIKHIYDTAPTEIISAIEPYGYFEPKVDSALTNIGDKWTANFYITLGKPVRINKLDIKVTGEGSDDPEFQRFLQKIPLHQGDILATANYKLTKQGLFDLAQLRGYIKAQLVQNEIRIDKTNYTADIVLHLETGPRYQFGAVTFDTTKFNPKFLHKFITFKPGEPYSSDLIHSTQENFNRSNLFLNVAVEPRLDKANGSTVPIVIHLTPQRSQQYSFGLGYGSDTGVRGTIGMNLYNLTSTGQHFEGALKAASNKEVSLEAHYIIPGSNPTINKWDISAATKIDDYNYGANALFKVGPGYTTVIHDWHQTIRLDWQEEWWFFQEGRDTKDPISWDDIKSADYQHSTLIVPSISWLKRVANDPVRPTKGYNISILAQGAVKGAVSDISFGQLLVNAKYMQPIPKGPILVLRGTAGYTLISSKDQPMLPLSFWLTAGGSQSIRGYNYQDIGPGTKLVVGSVELRQRLAGNVYGSLFFDAGNAADSNLLSTIHQGLGLALTWLSPIGAIQLSFARALDRADAPGMVQFSMGTEL